MRKPGTTLIELIVIVVISAIILSAVMTSYASLVKTNQKINVSRQLQKEINFAMIRLTDKMRSYSVDYEAYDSGNCSGYNLSDSNNLLCIQGEGETDSYFFNQGDFIAPDGETYKTLFMNQEPLFSSFFEVKNVHFFVTPSKDPFDIKNLQTPADIKAYNLQPKVTITLEVGSIQYEDLEFHIQTTISSRKYQ